jgi:hypothetical protein
MNDHSSWVLGWSPLAFGSMICGNHFKPSPWTCGGQPRLDSHHECMGCVHSLLKLCFRKIQGFCQHLNSGPHLSHSTSSKLFLKEDWGGGGEWNGKFRKVITKIEVFTLLSNSYNWLLPLIKILPTFRLPQYLTLFVAGMKRRVLFALLEKLGSNYKLLH